MRCFRMLVVVFAVFTFIKSDGARAQHQYDRWYFGFKQGLDFRTSPPKLISDGQTNTIEGSAVYCDPKTGDLLFYTDGSMVWDRMHRLMPSGKDLIADQSSTQSALIVPDPTEPKRFYLFHSDQSGYTQPTRGVYYSVIDLRLNGGYGDVTVKNQKLIHEGTEKLTAISICGGEAYWVIAHELITNNFVAWFVDGNGVSPLPVKSSIGVDAGPSPVSGAGYLAASPNGQVLASVIPQPPSVEIFQFDVESGRLHDRIELPAISKPYGVSFSPDNSKLYVIGDRELAQYDVSEWDSVFIARSRFRIKHTNRSEGALRLGPDRKIYVQESDSIGVIHWPDLAGDACQYTPGVYPLTPSGQFGLPNNIDALNGHDCKIPLARMGKYQTNICESTCVSFKDSSRFAPTSWLWLFEGATPATSSAKNPVNICYASQGSYNVTLIASNDAGSDTTHSVVRVRSCPTPVIALSDTTLCISECVTFIDTSTIATSWQWTFENAQPASYSGRTPPQVCFYKAGKQKVTLVASNQYGYVSATAIVTVKDCSLPIAKFAHDTSTCTGSLVSFSNQSRNIITRYEWAFPGGSPASSHERTPPPILYQTAGTYQVRLIASNGAGSDTMLSLVHVNDCFPPTAVLSDHRICEGDCIMLSDVSIGLPTYWKWKIDGGNITSSTLKTPGTVCFDTPGTYELQLIVGNASGEDTATRSVTVAPASARVTSSMILTEPLIACQSFDTAIWVTAGCKDAVIEDVISTSPFVFGGTKYFITAGGSARIPVTIRNDAPGGIETSIILKISGQELVVPCTYSVLAGPESFVFSFSEESFVAGHCTPVSRILSINHQACTPQRIEEIRIEANGGLSPFSTDFTAGASILPDAPHDVTVTYDPTLPGSTEAQLVITTSSGNATRFALRGIRNDLPTASIGLGAPSATSVLAGSDFTIPVQFETAVGDSAAPQQLDLKLVYDTDMFSLVHVEIQNGWTLLGSNEEHDGVRVQLMGPASALSAGEAVATLRFKSFLSEEESSSLSIEEIVCDPSDPAFGACTLETRIGRSNTVTVTGGCGVTELRKLLKDTKSLIVTVNPNPVSSSSEQLTVHITSTASQTNALQAQVELIDMSGKATLLFNQVLRSQSFDITLPLVGIPSGSYILRSTVGAEAESTRIVVER